MPDAQEKRSLKSRLVRSVAANSFSQGVTLVTQLLNVPLFAHFWGVDLWGEWVLLSTIPVYLAMSDLSFGATAGTEMTMLVGRGDRPRALQVLQSAWFVVTGLSVGLFLLFLTLTFVLPLNDLLNLSLLTRGESTAIMVVLLCQVFVAQQGGLIEASYKCDGNYASGVFWMNVMRLTEFAVGALFLFLGADPWTYAMAAVAVKSASYFLLWSDVTRRSPWIRLGWSHVDLGLARPLLGPAITFNAFPLGYALNIQGFTILAGMVGGGPGAALFSTMRTLVRVVWQVANGIALSIWAELSKAIGAGDYELARKIHRRAGQVALWVVLMGSGVMAVFGPWVYEVWTRRVVPFDPVLFGLLLLATILGSQWVVSYTVALATNRHKRIAGEFILCNAGAIGLGALLVRPMGMQGGALALALGELVMLGLVLRDTMGILKEDWGGYLRSIVVPPADLVQKGLRRLRRT